MRHFIAILIGLVLCSSCKEDTGYRYQDKPDIISCDDINYPLIKEAFYSFENDLYTHSLDSLQVDLEASYNRWIYPSQDNEFDIKTLVSPYTVKMFKRLQNESPDLFELTNPDSNLNYDSALMQCIVENVRDEELKVTFKALIDTGTMSPKLFGDRLIFNLLKVTRDPYMRYYVIMEYGYGRMFFNDFSEIESNG